MPNDPSPRADQAHNITSELHMAAKPLRREQAVRIFSTGKNGAGTIRDVAGETPVSITYNGMAYAVMMATPIDLEDFAAGFSLTQGAISSISEISDIDVHETNQGIVLRIQVPQDRFAALAARRRNVVGQTGCGICGIIELENALLPLSPLRPPPRIELSALFSALASMRERQPLHEATAAMHAAAFFDVNGACLELREDVGRHNAFDKMIGGLMRGARDPSTGFAVLTSRCSYELVEKAVLARIGVLVTVSAPTSLAVDRARQGGLTLVSLARPDSALVFNDPAGMFTDA